MTSSTVSEGRLHSLLRSSPLRELEAFCIFVAAYYCAYELALSFSPAFASPFWLPDTVFLCALLVNRPRHWWVYIIGTLPIRWFNQTEHGPGWFLLATF